jgi:hypothetical protein
MDAGLLVPAGKLRMRRAAFSTTVWSLVRELTARGVRKTREKCVRWRWRERERMKNLA